MSAWEGSEFERRMEEANTPEKRALWQSVAKIADGTEITLAARIEILANAHGSLRQLAESIGEDAGYLSRLRSGEKDNPSDEVLQKLGLVRVVKYQLRHTR